MTTTERIDLLVNLGKWMNKENENWQIAKENAHYANGWFTPEFIDIACDNIIQQFLQKEILNHFCETYSLFSKIIEPKTVGLVMAGNIPLVGFHDFLCCFLSGHDVVIKASSKDEILIKHLVGKLYEWEVTIQNKISFAQSLKGCDAYIATGSNNSSRYFEYYFAKYPSIIRKNRTSVAILSGGETKEELLQLCDDINFYYGQGCRNVTCVFVPKEYDFLPLLDALSTYNHLLDYHRYKNNYDYQLTLLIMNNKKYMTNGGVLLSESTSIFSAISQLHYQHYENKDDLIQVLKNDESVQCIVGKGFMPFGLAQKPSINDFADGVNTMQFLMNV